MSFDLFFDRPQEFIPKKPKQQKIYTRGYDPYHCEICNCTVSYNSKQYHLQTIKHFVNSNTFPEEFFMRQDSPEYQQKKEDLKKVSDITKVKKNATKYGFDPALLEVSTLKSKKYMYFYNGKYIHFGDFRLEDYSAHNDIPRRNKFRKRNDKWQYYDKFTPAYMSFHLLW